MILELAIHLCSEQVLGSDSFYALLPVPTVEKNDYQLQIPREV